MSKSKGARRYGGSYAADAEAICEAVTRPTMRFAPAKSAEQQSVLMLHRAQLLVRQRTMVIIRMVEDPGDLPPLAREALGSLAFPTM